MKVWQLVLFEGDQLKMNWRQTEDPLKASRKWNDDGIKFNWRFTEDPLKIHWRYTEAQLKFNWSSTDNQLKLNWRSAVTWIFTLSSIPLQLLVAGKETNIKLSSEQTTYKIALLRRISTTQEKKPKKKLTEYVSLHKCQNNNVNKMKLIGRWCSLWVLQQSFSQQCSSVKKCWTESVTYAYYRWKIYSFRFRKKENRISIIFIEPRIVDDAVAGHWTENSKWANVAYYFVVRSRCESGWGWLRYCASVCVCETACVQNVVFRAKRCRMCLTIQPYSSPSQIVSKFKPAPCLP